MRKLHLVGLTTDRDGLIFTARKGSKSGGFIVPLDAKVIAAVVAARNRDNGDQPEHGADPAEVEVAPRRLRSESALTPREMQARLRAGRSIDEVAVEAGVDTEWVARFAVPILAEQAQVVELARALVYAKPRLGESNQPLGVSVLQNLSDRGVFLPDDVANAGWSAFQLHDSVWMVRFRYRSRARDQEAQWEIDVPTGRLRARNRHASDLGYVDPQRWRTSDPEDVTVDVAEPPAARRQPRRPTRSASAPMAKAVAAAKKRTATGPPAARATAARPAAKAAKATKATKATKRVTAPATRAAKGARTPPATKTAARTASAKSTPRRRAAKAVPPEAGPAVGSGGVRMAVAQVSTARVAASMAAADRAPWAAAVRRSARPDGRPESGPIPAPTPVDSRRSRSAPVADPDRRGNPVAVRTFEPRPLPPPGREPASPPRVRKVTIPRTSGPSAGQPPVSLPAPRRPSPPQEPLPAERSKRRRIRPR